MSSSTQTAERASLATPEVGGSSLQAGAARKPAASKSQGLNEFICGMETPVSKAALLERRSVPRSEGAQVFLGFQVAGKSYSNGVGRCGDILGGRSRISWSQEWA